MWKLVGILLSVTIGIITGHYARYRRLENVDTRLDVSIGEFSRVPTLNACITMCAPPLCVYVSYHDGEQECRTHEINRNAVTGQTGWNIYFKELDEEGNTDMNLMDGASAFQSSTYDSLHAGLALDGDTNGEFDANSCSHTDNHYSYWVMEFGMSGVVEAVNIYLRSDVVKRNSNRRVIVAQTQQNAVDNVGIECGGYFGPVIDQAPYRLTIQCSGLIFGRFLRISYEGEDLMEICEVIVYVLPPDISS